jgi:hypothetical protein
LTALNQGHYLSNIILVKWVWKVEEEVETVIAYIWSIVLKTGVDVNKEKREPEPPPVC